ncbi:hypothetical protein P3L10_005620 [Capsicum annuum]
MIRKRKLLRNNFNDILPENNRDIASSSKAGRDVLRIGEPNQINPQVPRFPTVNVGDAPFQPTDRDKYYVELLTRGGVLFPNPATFQKATVDFPSSDGDADNGTAEDVDTELQLAPLGSK